MRIVLVTANFSKLFTTLISCEWTPPSASWNPEKLTFLVRLCWSGPSRYKPLLRDYILHSVAID
ncbi:hypothetical protein J6590_105393 [Homalodisca vitripennis]|nr:hypothetical protein J6590_105393 [Homalodisca vitripennis]